MKRWISLLLIFVKINISASIEKVQVPDDEYYRMPDLIQVDNFNKCLSQKDAVYCFGIFELSATKYSNVYEIIKKTSENVMMYYNHSQIRRGVCMGNLGSCPLNDSTSWDQSFESCVSEDTLQSFGLEAKLVELYSCQTNKERRTMDRLDYFFIFYVITIVGLNLIGTFYDIIIKEKRSKVNHWLACFSLSANWHRLTRRELPTEKFLCFNGLRVLMSFVVHMGHAFLSMSMYSTNPKFFEEMTQNPWMKPLFNGTLGIEIFIIMSSFLIAHKIITVSNKRTLNMNLVTELVLDRIVRISPAYMTVLGYSATLAAHSSDGPLWKKYVHGEADDCRRTFWRHLFFYNNYYGLKCLAQTWYLSTDFQLYVILICLMVYLMKKKKNLLQALFGVLISSLIILFGIVYALEFKAVMLTINPGSTLKLFDDERSFFHLYQSAWCHIPSAVIGLIAGVAYHNTINSKTNFNKNHVFAMCCHLSAPFVFIFIAMGPPILNAVLNSRFGLSLYSTLDKPAFASIIVFIMFGCLIQKNVFYRSALEWPGWTVLGRLSLCSLLIHAVINRALVSHRLLPSTLSFLNCCSEGFATSAMTYLLSLPLCLLVEYPAIQLYGYRAISTETETIVLNSKDN